MNESAYASVPTSDPTESTAHSSIPGDPPVYSGASPPSYASAEAGGINEFKQTLELSNVLVRLAFVRKVYSILSAQMGLTTIVSALFMYSPIIKSYIQSK